MVYGYGGQWVALQYIWSIIGKGRWILVRGKNIPTKPNLGSPNKVWERHRMRGQCSQNTRHCTLQQKCYTSHYTQQKHYTSHTNYTAYTAQKHYSTPSWYVWYFSSHQERERSLAPGSWQARRRRRWQPPTLQPEASIKFASNTFSWLYHHRPVTCCCTIYISSSSSNPSQSLVSPH